MSIEWVFDPASPSGSRRGGNAAEYGFEGHIDTLVRETVQNSMDAGNPVEKRVDIGFRMVELTGENMESFLDAMAWDSLRDNLEAVSRHGESIKRAIEEMYERNRILLLCIEDKNTYGLTGAEKRENDQETNRFSALVRDELYSDKDHDDAGGSFGLGKILLWVYSAYKTVLFSTVPERYPEGRQGLRFIGRTSLPYHETEGDGPCSGPGWLGIKKPAEHGHWAVSVWGDEAARYARQSHAYREPHETGLTTVIVGFEEPGQETREVADILDSIVNASLESFWPALTRNYIGVKVCHELDGQVVQERDVIPDEHQEYSVLSKLLNDFDNGQLEEMEYLARPGDAAFRRIDIEIPERVAQAADGAAQPHPEFTGSSVLLVRLLDEDSEKPSIKDRIYRFRRPGMIVRQSGGSGLSISARPYTAAVLCGRAADGGEEHDRIERFLRAAEPPEHDRWAPDTRAIKSFYKTRGIKAKLGRFENNIKTAIRDLVSLPEKKGGALPKELLKHLRFGDSTGGGNPRFLTAKINAGVNGDHWKFDVRLRRTRPDPDGGPWHAIVRLKYAIDGGAAIDAHAIEKVACEKATKIDIRNGIAWLQFPPDVQQAVLAGVTSTDKQPAAGTRSAIQIRVDGKLGELPNV